MPEITVRKLNESIAGLYSYHECRDGDRQSHLISEMISVFNVSREAAVYRAIDLQLASQNNRVYLLEKPSSRYLM